MNSSRQEQQLLGKRKSLLGMLNMNSSRHMHFGKSSVDSLLGMLNMNSSRQKENANN